MEIAENNMGSGEGCLQHFAPPRFTLDRLPLFDAFYVVVARDNNVQVASMHRLRKKETMPRMEPIERAENEYSHRSTLQQQPLLCLQINSVHPLLIEDVELRFVGVNVEVLEVPQLLSFQNELLEVDGFPRSSAVGDNDDLLLCGV